MNRRLPGGAPAVTVAVVAALAGWWRGAPLVVVAALLALGGLVLVGTWRSRSLRGVTYERSLGASRATFGEEVALRTTVTNDKLLPLTWLQVEDELSGPLTIRGGVVRAPQDVRHVLTQLLPLLPFQRVSRRMTVVCDRRGEHRFGPCRLRSGDPLGWGTDVRSVAGEAKLLVYPKVFALNRLGAAARLPLGPDRAAPRLAGDPTRVVGVRPYRAGDPVRLIDWRATARSHEAVVRILEPTASLRAALFVDLRAPQLGRGRVGGPELEFTIAVAASLAADLVDRSVGLGLYSNGTVQGRAVALHPTSAPGALAEVLELLARASPFGGRPFAEVLVSESAQLPRGTSCVVVAASLPESTLVALDELRRRHLSVSLVGVATDEELVLPPPGLVDACFVTEYSDAWADLDHLDLAG